MVYKSFKDMWVSFSLIFDYDDINEVFFGFSCCFNLCFKSSWIVLYEFVNMFGGFVVEYIVIYLFNV